MEVVVVAVWDVIREDWIPVRDGCVRKEGLRIRRYGFENFRGRVTEVRKCMQERDVDC